MPYFPASQRYSLPYRAIEMRRERALKLAGGVAPSRQQGVPRKPRDDAGFGAQGGDPRRGVDMDLSTCVNRYGPAPAAVAALHSIPADDILLHPYDAAERIVELYRWATGVTTGTMIAGRGASEFICAMGREVDHADVRVPIPAYTDYLKAFPGRGFTVSGEQIPTVKQVDAALGSTSVVIVSNPHNPTGTLLAPKELIATADAHPGSTLVVDESYINFTSNPIEGSTLGCDVPNLVVLRSTSKFYGIAATRAGIAWCADDEPLKRLFGQQENWGLSGLDVRVVCAAVRDFHWATHSRVRMRDDSEWLADVLSDVPGIALHRNADVHFQYAFCERAEDVAEVFRRHGIGVRVLGIAHGVHPDALRIVAPRSDERKRFLGALADVEAMLTA